MNRHFKKTIIISTPFAIFLAAALIWVQLIKPNVLAFAKAQIPNINSTQNFFSLELEELDVSLLKLQALATNIKIEFKDKSLNLEPILIQNVTAQIDIFSLIIGQINIAKLTLDNSQLVIPINTKSNNDALPKIPIEMLFSNIKVVPVDRVHLTNTKVQLLVDKKTTLAQINAQKITLANLRNEIVVSLDKILISSQNEVEKNVQAEINFNAKLTPNKLNLKLLTLHVLDSSIESEGEFTDYADLLNAPRGEVSIKSQINLQDLRNVMLTFFPQKNRIPSVAGQISTQGKLQLNTLNEINGEISINTSQVVLDHFKLGQAELTTTIHKNQISINEINLEHTAGNAKFKNIKIQQKSPYHFSTTLEYDSFDLQKLFQAIGLADIPASFKSNGQAQCEGLLAGNLLVTCNVSTALKEMWVKSSLADNSSIVKLAEAKINGEVKFTKEKVNYSADIFLGKKSTGTSQGEVKFDEGFKIQYETHNLDFSDVESLAGLNLKGVSKIIGNTTGDSHHGLINAVLSASSAEIENFSIGNLKSNLDYKDGKLSFSNLNMLVGKSSFAGHLNFDFSASTLSSEVESQDLYGEDLLSILNKRFNLPFELNGRGKAQVSLHGPFDFWKLTYNLNSELNQGRIAGERFEKLTAHLTANGQQVNFNNVRLKKLKTNLTLDGHINTQSSEPLFNLTIKTNPLQLEESDHIIQYAPAIAGVGYSDGTITGPVSNPTIASNITLKQITYDKVEYPNSQGQLKLDKKYFSFGGQFFGRQIQSEILWPWDEKDPFSAKILIQELNPLFLLPLISIPQPGSDFYSRLNAEIDLTSKHRSLSTADGTIKISDLFIQRGNHTLKLNKPSHLHFKNGLTQMEDVDLIGDDSFLKMKMDKVGFGKIRLNIESDLQLKLLHFLVPFTQNLSGKLLLNSQVIFKDHGFELLGDGEINDGLVGLKGFPQPIENINAPIEFTKSKIILSDITGQIGPSDVTGIGQIDILGSQNIAVNLRAIADNVQLNFPAKMLTQGKANVLFSGNWLPYNLKIDYKVTHGLIENDFEPDPKQNLSLKASNFLPPQQVQMMSPSLALDINVDLTNGLLIKNKLIEGEAKGNIQVQGSPEQPILLGKINILQGSKLIFKDKPFEIQNAIVQFQGTKEINPDIYIAANSRVSDYDINLLVQGLAKNLTITPTSQPPLSTNDIFTLLALGVTNQANQTLSSDTQQKQTGLEVLAALSNQSQLNKKIQERLGLTVQLAPSVDSTKNIAVPKVVVSKKISKKVNASYSKPFTGNDQNQEVKLQYLYNNNVSFQLNYQNKETTQQDQITNSTNNNKSILGIDLEYRDEFK